MLSGLAQSLLGHLVSVHTNHVLQVSQPEQKILERVGHFLVYSVCSGEIQFFCLSECILPEPPQPQGKSKGSAISPGLGGLSEDLIGQFSRADTK